MRATVQFKGGAELQRTLLSMRVNDARGAGRAALRKAARVIANAAKANVPVREGRLKRAIAISVNKARYNSDEIRAKVYLKFDGTYRPSKTKRARYNYQIGSNPKVYGAFIEFGTENMRARPFLRPAWEAVGGQMSLDLIGKQLWVEIDKRQRKLGKINATGRNA